MRPERYQRGFGLVAAMFVIIIIAAVIATMARLSVGQNAATGLAIQQARAYQAAQAGLEWGINRAVSGQPCASDFTLSGFAIVVTCTATAPVLLAEENRTVQFYALTATAQYGVTGSPDYAYRQLSAVVER
jgi:MSHA biogenesis protein MshP